MDKLNEAIKLTEAELSFRCPNCSNSEKLGPETFDHRRNTVVRFCGHCGVTSNKADCIVWPDQAATALSSLKALAEREAVNHPAHYGGADNPYEAIKVIEAWRLGFNLGNTIKYISRAGKKGSLLADLKKAAWYLNREIEWLENKPRENSR